MRPPRNLSGGHKTHIALPSSLDNNTPSLTADPYGQPPCTPAGLFILWHHYRRPRSRKRPTVASKQLQDLPYLPHPGTSGHTSSRSRVSPAESLASLLRSPSSGQQHRLCCQRLQGRPLVWLISQSQTFRGPRNGTAQIAIPRYLSRNSTRHCYQRLCKSQEDLPYSSLLLLFCHHRRPSLPSCTALPCSAHICLPPASRYEHRTCNSCSQVHHHARHLSTSTRLSITPIFSLLHIRTAPAHPLAPTTTTLFGLPRLWSVRWQPPTKPANQTPRTKLGSRRGHRSEPLASPRYWTPLPSPRPGKDPLV